MWGPRPAANRQDRNVLRLCTLQRQTVMNLLFDTDNGMGLEWVASRLAQTRACHEGNNGITQGLRRGRPA